jgi:hypothetical protein
MSTLIDSSFVHTTAGEMLSPTFARQAIPRACAADNTNASDREEILCSKSISMPPDNTKEDSIISP